MVLDLPTHMSDANPAVQWQDPAFVQQFLNNVRGSIPLTIEQIDMMLRVIDAARERVRNFLVLGCGNSLLASAILDEHPNARGFLVDDSEAAIDSARRHLRAHSDRLRILHADVSRSDWMNVVAAGIPFDAIVSGTAIRHSDDDGKRVLYRQVFHLLRPEGIFINLEHVTSPTRWTDSAWDDRMIDTIFGQQLRAAPRAARVDVARAYYACVSHDAAALAPLEVRCDWLREIGFESVDCFLKVQELAMFGGQRGTK